MLQLIRFEKIKKSSPTHNVHPGEIRKKITQVAGTPQRPTRVSNYYKSVHLKIMPITDSALMVVFQEMEVEPFIKSKKSCVNKTEEKEPRQKITRQAAQNQKINPRRAQSLVVFSCRIFHRAGWMLLLLAFVSLPTRSIVHGTVKLSHYLPGETQDQDFLHGHILSGYRVFEPPRKGDGCVGGKTNPCSSVTFLRLPTHVQHRTDFSSSKQCLFSGAVDERNRKCDNDTSMIGNGASVFY